MHKPMKSIIYTWLSLLVMISSCQEEESVSQPQACFATSVETSPGQLEPSSTAQVGQNVTFTLCSEADRYTLWPGDEGHDISGPTVEFNEEQGTASTLNTGFNINVADGEIVYSYSQPGTYQAALIATNVVYAGEAKQDTVFQTVTITE